MHIRFPQYDQPSSALLRMYLAGEFGSHRPMLTPLPHRPFLPLTDMPHTKKTGVKITKNGATILSDRYVSSNLIHQGSKLEGEEALEFF